MVDEKEWSPESDDEPLRLQREQVEMGKQFLARLKKEEEERAAREAEYTAASPTTAGRAYISPTAEEISAVLKKAWDEVERIMPTAGDRVKAMAFQTLMGAFAPPPKFE